MAKEAQLKSVTTSALKISTGADLGRLEGRIQEAIAFHAYDLFERRGRQQGSDMQDWFGAEAEIQRPENVATVDEGRAITITVRAAGFDSSEIEVGVAPSRVVIWGLKEKSKNASKSAGESAESGFGAFLADIRLAASVQPAKSTASLADDQIEVHLTK